MRRRAHRFFASIRELAARSSGRMRASSLPPTALLSSSPLPGRVMIDKRGGQRASLAPSDLSSFGRCLSEAAHDILSRDHTFQLAIGIHHRKAPYLETHHQL